MQHLQLSNATVQVIEEFLCQDIICNHWAFTTIIEGQYVGVYLMGEPTQKPILKIKSNDEGKVLCFSDDGVNGSLSIVEESEFEYYVQGGNKFKNKLKNKKK